MDFFLLNFHHDTNVLQLETPRTIRLVTCDNGPLECWYATSIWQLLEIYSTSDVYIRCGVGLIFGRYPWFKSCERTMFIKVSITLQVEQISTGDQVMWLEMTTIPLTVNIMIKDVLPIYHRGWFTKATRSLLWSLETFRLNLYEDWQTRWARRPCHGQILQADPEGACRWLRSKATTQRGP